MSNKMSEFIKKMGMVNEPGIRDEKVIKENKLNVLSNEKNSITNAILAYDNMTGKNRLQESVEKKEGALIVMKEIVESNNSVDEKINKIKQLLTNF